MKISNAIQERAHGGLPALNANPQWSRDEEELREHNVGRGLRIVQGKAVELSLKRTELQVRAFSVQGSKGLNAVQGRTDLPSVMADQEGPKYVSSHLIAGQYAMDKVPFQIPQIIINKYRESEGYTKQTKSTLQVYA